VVGFTNGIAVLIASTQIKDFLGLQIESVPGEFLGRMEAVFSHIHTTSVTATLVGASSLAVIIVLMRYARRVPGYIFALVIGTIVVALLNLPVETIGTRFGGIPGGLPQLVIPSIEGLNVMPLLSPALTIALLGAIESLMSAVVADRMSGDKHDPNVELVAQGIANIVTPFFGGIPATGAIARTATNIRSGARTPVAGIVHALTLLGVLLFAAPLAQFIPLSILSGILFVVAYNMGECREIPKLLRMSGATIVIWAVTFGLTVFADLTIAVEFGIVLAALMFIRKVANTTTVSRVTAEYIEQGRRHILQDKSIPDFVAVFRVHGPFLFGAQEKLTSILDELELLPPIVILRLRNMTAIDATGLLAFEELSHRLAASGRTLILCSARTQPAKLLHQSGFIQAVGTENICADIETAVERAKQVISSGPQASKFPVHQR
jgi:SulP family sulfate permease